MLVLALTPLVALAQGASLAETDAVARIAECIVEGAPPDWKSLFMVVDLEKPGDETGKVRYVALRLSQPDQLIAYTPCDLRKPAMILLEARKRLAPERKGWIGARITLHQDGKFELHYDYPK